jgi:hypothetical protein
MAATPFRPPWLSNVGVQVAAGLAVVYNVVRIVLALVDSRFGDAFLSFAWSVVFGYVLVESLRARREQQAHPVDGTPADPVD